MPRKKRKVVLPEPGEEIGRYTFVTFEGMSPAGQQWEVRCECGQYRSTSLAQLKHEVARGKVRCGKCSHGRHAYARGNVEQRVRHMVARFGERAPWMARVDIDKDLPERW